MRSNVCRYNAQAMPKRPFEAKFAVTYLVTVLIFAFWPHHFITPCQTAQRRPIEPRVRWRCASWRHRRMLGRGLRPKCESPTRFRSCARARVLARQRCLGLGDGGLHTHVAQRGVLVRHVHGHPACGSSLHGAVSCERVSRSARITSITRSEVIMPSPVRSISPKIVWPVCSPPGCSRPRASWHTRDGRPRRWSRHLGRQAPAT